MKHDLESLYPIVTEAILRAEVLEDLEAPGALAAYADVSLLEERIAECLPPSDPEGAIARRGAVRAAVSARQFDRVDDLLARYRAEAGVGADLRKGLRSLRSLATRARAESPAKGTRARAHSATESPGARSRATALEAGVEDDVVVLAEELVALLSDSRSIFLGSGSILRLAAAKLSNRSIATNDLKLALAAAEGNNDVTLLGRSIDTRTLTLLPLEVDAETWFDTAVFETQGIDSKSFWAKREDHSFLATVQRRSDSLVIVARKTAVEKKGALAAPVSRVDVAIVEGASSEDWRRLRSAGIDLRVAGERPADDGARETFRGKRAG